MLHRDASSSESSDIVAHSGPPTYQQITITMPSVSSENPVSALRRFTRNYVKHLGLVSDRLYGSSYTLTDSHVLFQLQYGPHTVKQLAVELKTEEHIVEDSLRLLLERGQTELCGTDTTGQEVWQRTANGRTTSEALCSLTERKVDQLLAEIPDKSDRDRLIAATVLVDKLLSQDEARGSPATPSSALRVESDIYVRSMKGGDSAWLTLSFAEWTENVHGLESRIFEAYLSQEFSNFLKNYDDTCERMFTAVRQVPVDPTHPERGMRERRIGGVFCSQMSPPQPGIARLAMIFVDPAYHGQGVGKLLMNAVMDFARSKGYSKIRLVTHRYFVEARRMYAKTGWKVIHRRDGFTDWGFETTLEWWEKDL